VHDQDLPHLSPRSPAVNNRTVDTSIFAFASDLVDEGLETVLDNVQHRAGLGGVTVAAVYHEARDLFPHNPVRKLRFLEGGVTYFRPDAARYGGLAIQPRVARLAQERDVVRELVGVAERRGLAAHAWTVFLHSDWQVGGSEDHAERTAFGDPRLTELCPANPEVRDYVRALAGDVAGLGVRTIVAESLHYHPLEHGYHHERYFLHLGARSRFLLGLCFCPHCLAAASAAGVDADAVHRFAREEIQRVFDGGADDGTELTFDEARALAGGELGAYLAARERTVSTLAGEAAAAAAAEGARFAFLDASGAIKGYADGRPAGGPSPEIAWLLGVDLAQVGRATGALEAIAYAADPDRIRLDLDAYRALLAPGGTLSAALRPILPDCDSTENLTAKLRLARELGLERVDFYHYGFAPLPALDRIREALQAR
jgi:hypothetical protein